MYRLFITIEGEQYKTWAYTVWGGLKLLEKYSPAGKDSLTYYSAGRTIYHNGKPCGGYYKDLKDEGR